GEQWTQIPLKEHPRSIFFLNENAGWMLTDDSIWFTNEAGRNWKKIADQPKAPKNATFKGTLLERLWFLDEKHGFGAGFYKTVLETQDGGLTWKPVEEASKPTSTPGYTVYSQIAFDADKMRGMIVGGSVPPRREDLYRPPLPSWMEPERAAARRQVPTLT